MRPIMNVQSAYSSYPIKYLESLNGNQTPLLEAVLNLTSSFSPFDLVIAAKIVHAMNMDQATLQKIDQIINEKLISPSNPKEIRASLEAHGILPTAKEAKKIFWSLGENWWKQILDGKHHKYGKWVYDKGLHKGPIEPGYLNGVEAGCQFFTDRFSQDLDVALYRGIHHEACAHFKGIETQTVCGVERVDEYRTEIGKCFCPPYVTEWEELRKRLNELQQHVTIFDTVEKLPSNEHLKALAKSRDWVIANIDSSLSSKTDEDLGDILYEKIRDMKEVQYLVAEKQEEVLLQEFVSIASRLTLDKPFVKCWPEQGHNNELYIFYEPSTELDKVIEKLLNEFNKNLEVLQKKCYEKIHSQMTPEFLIQLKDDYQNKVISLIARLYAELEWAHPWIDGQGRTDLILLNGLLCREGLHPCILNEPYYSTGSTIQDWIIYLKEGLKEFEQQY